MTYDPKADLKRLYHAEYGDPTDICMRTVGVVVGGTLLYLQTSWAAAYLWGLGFAMVHCIQWPFLRYGLKAATKRKALIGGLLFVLVHISFIWLPTYAAGSEDLGLMLIGMLVFVVTAMYHIRRSDNALWLVLVQIVIFATSLIYIAWIHFPRIDQPIMQLILCMATAMAVAYVAMTMLAAHKKQLEIVSAGIQLAQEQKLSAIGRLAGGIAHDFNNVLTVIKGNLELHDHLNSPEEKKAVLADAHLAAERAEGVIQKLLIYARKAPAKKRMINVNIVLDEIEAFSKTIVPERISLTIQRSERPIRLELDDRMLTTALLNLVKNSIDAIPKNGSIDISISEAKLTKSLVTTTGDKLAAGKYAVVVVSDSGVGIPENLLSAVVDPFFTTKDPGKGTGLGLSMVLGFAQDLGGGLTVESSAFGAKISIFFPTPTTLDQSLSGRVLMSEVYSL